MKNIDSFVNYLLSRKCPGLPIRKDFIPDAHHGAALAQMMQNAVAFDYYNRREAAVVNPVIFNGYKVSYTSKDTSLPDALIFTDENKLYLKFNPAGDLPAQLIPLNKTEYFMAENERLLFTFKMKIISPYSILFPE